MFDPWVSLFELQQPCLRRPISDRMLDTDGLVRREIMNSLDRLFCEHLAVGRAAFQAPASPAPIPIEHRFINVSALQKSIRRGDAKGAIRFAQQGCGLNREQVFRRLATCAVEDVGIGNLLAVGMALAVMGNRAMREHSASDELAAYLAYSLAISPKSRLACDLISIADYDRTLDPIRRRLAQTSVVELAAAATNRATTDAERMVAAWLLAGTSRFRGVTMPEVKRYRRDFMRLMAFRRVPLILYYIADRTAARLGDAMFVSFLPIATMTKAEPTMTVRRGLLINAGTIGAFPAAAFDLHTTEGRAALSRFGRECAPIAQIVGALPPTLRDVAVRHAVFIAEGGRLTDQVQFEDGDQIEAAAHNAELKFAGIAQQQRGLLIATVCTSMSQLNAIRLAVFDSTR